MSVEEYLTKIKGYNLEEKTEEVEIEGRLILKAAITDEAYEEIIERINKIPSEYREYWQKKIDEHDKRVENRTETEEDKDKFYLDNRKCPKCGLVQSCSYYDICEKCSYPGGKTKVLVKNSYKEQKLREYCKVRELRGWYKYALNCECPKCKSKVPIHSFSCDNCSTEFIEFYKQEFKKMKIEERYEILEYNSRLEEEISKNRLRDYWEKRGVKSK